MAILQKTDQENGSVKEYGVRPISTDPAGRSSSRMDDQM